MSGYSMLAFNQAPNATYVAKSGNSYVSDAWGIFHNVVVGDVLSLINDGALMLGPTQRANTIPWVTGRFYGLPAGSTQAAVLTVAGTLYAYPVSIPSPVTLASIGISVTTGQTGGSARAALFYDNGAGYPGAIVPNTDTGNLDGTGTAVVSKTGLATVLPQGLYWVGSIFKATSTMPSVIGATATYTNAQNAALGCDTAAHALATSGEVTTGIAITGQTYPVTDMPTSFPTFPASAALTINATTPIAVLGV